MKRFFKVIAVLILIIHVFAVLIYSGIIPVNFFTAFRLPDAGRLAEFILRLNDEEEAAKSPDQMAEEAEEEKEEETEVAGPADTEEREAPDKGEETEDVQIELSVDLPVLTEEDLYDLPQVLIEAGALKAVDARGNDCSDQIICELAADINHPGHFTAVFSAQTVDGQIERGPSADMQVEMTAPFLGFREDNLTIPAGTDYDPYRNILICLDIDGTVLTEFVEYEGYLDTSQAGDYELSFFIYSRVNPSSTFRTMRIHVE